MSIGITNIQYVLPEQAHTLEALEASGRLESPAGRLREFGFDRVHVSAEPAETLAIEAVGRLLRESAVDPESIDAIFYAGAIPASHCAGAAAENFLHGFNYPVSRVQFECGLVNAAAAGVSQLGCLGLMSAVRSAEGFLAASPAANRVICVSADVFPHAAPREVIYNAISDGAAALLIERGAARNRLLAYRQITKGYYWDCIARKNEIVAAYFPTAQHIVRETLTQAALTLEEIDWLLPHNVSRRSWEILLGLLGLPREKLFDRNIAAKGHVIAADNFINLADLTDLGLARPGQKLLMFNFGLGANWGCMILEH
jgi:3-oxoacyl-[acyl-carrier-protein] synthase-3